MENTWRTTQEAAVKQLVGPSSGIKNSREETNAYVYCTQNKSGDYLAVRVRARVLSMDRAPFQGVQNARGGRPRLGDLARRDVDSVLDVGELLQQVLLDGIDQRGSRWR